MIAALFWLFHAHHVQVLIGEREWYGHVCEVRAVEIEIDGRWFETKPRRCG